MKGAGSRGRSRGGAGCGSRAGHSRGGSIRWYSASSGITSPSPAATTRTFRDAPLPATQSVGTPAYTALPLLAGLEAEPPHVAVRGAEGDAEGGRPFCAVPHEIFADPRDDEAQLLGHASGH
jgi:hypothetical protein